MKTKLAALVIIVVGGVAAAHTGATGVVKERMDAMSAMADAMKVIVPMTRGEVEYDPAAFAAAADSISDHAGTSLVEMFPAGSMVAPSEASPRIWEELDRFAELSETLEDAASDLSRAAMESSTLPADEFGAMARTCGACHRDYRIETES